MGCCGGGSSVSSTFSHIAAPSYHAPSAPYSGGTYYQTGNVTSDPVYPDHRFNSQQFTAPTGDRFKSTVIVGPENQVCANVPQKGVMGSFLSGLFNFLR